MSFAKLAADALVSDLTPEVSLASEQETARKAKLRKALLYTAAGLAGVGAAGAGLYYANKSGVLDPVKNSISSALGDTGLFGGSRVAGGAAAGAAAGVLAGSRRLDARLRSARGGNTLAELKTQLDTAKTVTHDKTPADFVRRVFGVYDPEQRMAAERLAEVTKASQTATTPVKPGNFEKDLAGHRSGQLTPGTKNLISQIMAGEASISGGRVRPVVDSSKAPSAIARFFAGSSETQRLAKNMQEIADRAAIGNQLKTLQTNLGKFKSNPQAVQKLKAEIAELSKHKFLADNEQKKITLRASALDAAAQSSYKRSLAEISRDIKTVMGHTPNDGKPFLRSLHGAGRGLWGGIVGGGLGAASHMFW